MFTDNSSSVCLRKRRREITTSKACCFAGNVKIVDFVNTSPKRELIS